MEILLVGLWSGLAALSFALVGYLVYKNKLLKKENDKANAELNAANAELNAANAELSKKMAELEELNSTHGDLCQLVEQTNDRASLAEKTSEENLKYKAQIDSFAEQLRENTDIEFATLDQLFEEVRKRKSRFLLLRPDMYNGVDILASCVTKYEAIKVFQSALETLGHNTYGDGNNDDGSEEDETDWS
jgi:multidrug efflux pump subunit AcrA (membrane-fusion protein)